MPAYSTSHRQLMKRITFLDADLAKKSDAVVNSAVITAPSIEAGSLKIPLSGTGYGTVSVGAGGVLIDELLSVEAVFKVSKIVETTEIRIGVGSAFNADPDAVAASAWLKIVGQNTAANAHLVYVESDDAVLDINDEPANGIQIPVGVWCKAKLDFRSGIQSISVPGKSKGGKGSIQFAVTAERGYAQHVRGLTKHIDMSNYAGVIGPYFHAEKTGAGGATDSIVYLRELCMEYNSF